MKALSSQLPRFGQQVFDYFAVVVLAAFLGGVPLWANLTGLSDKVRLSQRLQGISWAHPLGTDVLGRDLLLRFHACFSDAVLYLWATVLLATAMSVAYFCLTAALEWHPKAASILRSLFVVMASLTAVPTMILAFVFAIVLTSADIWGVCNAIFICVFVRVYVLLYQHWLIDRHKEYWLAAEATGIRPLAVVWQYGCRQAWKQTLAQVTCFHMSIAIVVEASISYLGFATAEPAASVGNILASHLELYLKGDFGILLLVIGFLFYLQALPGCFWRLASARRSIGVGGIEVRQASQCSF